MTLFESKKTKEYIKYDDNKKQLDIVTDKFIFGEGDEPYVLGNVLLQYLNDLITALNTHTHTGVTTGSGVSGVPSASFAAPTGDEVSEKIYGK